MENKRMCSGCQKPFEANGPDGLCPECLLEAGLGPGVDLGPDSHAESGRTPFVGPSPEEVARLFPQVEILGFIAQDAVGATYKAQQNALDHAVALKVLPPGIGKDPAIAECFTREAEARAIVPYRTVAAAPPVAIPVDVRALRAHGSMNSQVALWFSSLYSV